MKYPGFLVAILVLFPVVVSAHKSNAGSIQSGVELVEWCKSKGEAHFARKGITPYNWTASWWTDVNVLVVAGSWRIGNDDIHVECRVHQGAKKGSAKFHLVEKTTAP